MDNKPLEEQAENFIKSQLLKYDFKIVKPSFDKKGADLIILNSINEEKSKFLIVQSKGRTITNKTTSVSIPIEYVKSNFILFIYCIKENKEEVLLVFFENEINKWKINGDKYILTLNETNLKLYNSSEFNRSSIPKITKLLNVIEEKNYTSLIIDGIFLEKAINLTYDTYNEIWPNRLNFFKPKLSDVINNILYYYDKYKAKRKTINCYLLLSKTFDLESRVEIDNEHSFLTKNDNEIKLFINKTDNLIVFEVIEQLDRLVTNDNIILVADDVIYENPINDIKEKGYEIIVIKMSENYGSNLFMKMRWGDIILPLGISLGLEKHEL